MLYRIVIFLIVTFGFVNTLKASENTKDTINTILYYNINFELGQMYLIKSENNTEPFYSSLAFKLDLRSLPIALEMKTALTNKQTSLGFGVGVQYERKVAYTHGALYTSLIVGSNIIYINKYLIPQLNSGIGWSIYGEDYLYFRLYLNLEKARLGALCLGYSYKIN